MKVYNLERAKTIDVVFQLGDELIPVACDLDRAARDYPRIGAELDAAYKALQASSSDTYDERYIALANVVRSLLDLMFGDEAQKVVDYFESKWIEILIQIMPCLEDGVVPAIRAYAEEQQKKILAMQRTRK